jgi:2-keto-4-pentenoate hydratase/2-oxohepta-3-ene-1,7-dioic acid hydratase in catechol pathway
MRFSSFSIGGRPTWGVVANDNSLVEARGIDGAPSTLDMHIESLSPFVTQQLVGAAERGGGIDPVGVTWLPPVGRPSKILGVAINNTLGQRVAFRPFANPAFFLKPASSLVGHGQPIVVRDDFGVTHPEPELAIVIGQGGKNIPEPDALGHVFGYTIINDVTSPGLKEQDSIELVAPTASAGGAYAKLTSWRNVRDEDHLRSNYLTYHARSKGTDTFGPIGPWIVTADQIPDPNNLAVYSFDGDTPVFVDSTANLVFSVQRIIAHASAYMTLVPGDIIHCGTSMRPADNSPYRGLTDWDIRAVEGRATRIEIEGVGTLSNPVHLEVTS